MKTILVLGCEEDDHAVHMQRYLRDRGHDVELLDSRWFPGEMTLSFDPQLRRGTIGLPGGRTLGWEEIRSVYWRNYPGVSYPDLPDIEQARLAHNEARSLFETLLIHLPARWVNGWAAFQLHQAKPVQLARIAALGVHVPATLATNHPADVREFSQRWPRTIVKPVQGGDHARILGAEHLTELNLERLRLAPITLQEEAPGTNMRVFVAGERVLACEVRTDQVDYREDPQPQLLAHELPAPMQALSRRIAQELELVWTGIDFRLTPDGAYVFLEANPSPMFLGFEEATGLPLTKSLAHLLTQ